MKLLLPANDVFGGLVSAAVAIPLAMGYGMFAFAPFGENYFEDGALAGIVTAFVVAIACVLLGDKTTTVYAPRVTSTFFLGLLIYGLAHSSEPAVAAGGPPLVLAIAFSIVLLAGALESLFGLINLGTLIKFTPQPVMAGFQNAAAALLFLVQIGNICGFDRTVPFTQAPQHLDLIKPLSVAVAAITFAAMWNAKKLAPKVPPMLVGIGVGCILYYLGKVAGLGALSRPDHCERAARGDRSDSFSLFYQSRAHCWFRCSFADDPWWRTGAGHYRLDRCAVMRQARNRAMRAAP